MALRVNFLFILILLALFDKALSFPDEISSEIQTQDMQALIAQACMNIKNQNSCLANIQNELTRTGPPSATSVINAVLRTTINEALGAINNMTKISTFSVNNREQLAI
ncbi:pectinesterase [Trifolium repens]|jgi:pectinesterase|nr:putative pectinesterase/pectinesterase inhibitor [Trifolium repens]WJX37303.1 pectinesterase [Trifolium repens]